MPLALYLIPLDDSITRFDDETSLQAAMQTLYSSITLTHVVSAGEPHEHVKSMVEYTQRIAEQDHNSSFLVQKSPPNASLDDFLSLLLRDYDKGRVGIVAQASFIWSLVERLEAMDRDRLLAPRHMPYDKDANDTDNKALCYARKFPSRQLDAESRGLPIREWMLVAHAANPLPNALPIYTARHTRSFVPRGIITVRSMTIIATGDLTQKFLRSAADDEPTVTDLSRSLSMAQGEDLSVTREEADANSLLSHSLPLNLSSQERDDVSFARILHELQSVHDPSTFVARRMFVFQDNGHGKGLLRYLQAHSEWVIRDDTVHMLPHGITAKACALRLEKDPVLARPGTQLMMWLPKKFAENVAFALQHSTPNTRQMGQLRDCISRGYVELAHFQPKGLCTDSEHMTRVEGSENIEVHPVFIAS